MEPPRPCQLDSPFSNVKGRQLVGMLECYNAGREASFDYILSHSPWQPYILLLLPPPQTISIHTTITQLQYTINTISSQDSNHYFDFNI